MSDSKKNKVEIGSKAPLFSLPDKDGMKINLKDYLGKKIIVLYFYPKDYTQGCTTQACSFRDRYELFKKADAEVIGVSSDSEESHQEFSTSYQLPFVLLSDVNGEVRKLYEVSKTMGLLPGRVTYVINKKGFIRHIFSSQFNPKKHIDEALGIIAKLNEEK